MRGPTKFGAGSPHLSTQNGELLPGAMISANCGFSAKIGHENDCRVDVDGDSPVNENRHGVKLITEDCHASETHEYLYR
jgi:hypothetical protein